MITYSTSVQVDYEISVIDFDVRLYSLPAPTTTGSGYARYP